MLRISLQLDDFASSEVYHDALEKDIDAVKAWLRSTSLENVPWAGVFEVCKASNQDAASLRTKLAKALTRILNSSQYVLKSAKDTGEVLAPEDESAATDAFKLSFFFICHLIKANNSSWPVRETCSRALVAAELSLLEAVDKRAAELLLLNTLLDILAAGGSPVSDASLKSVAAATKKTVVDYLAELLSQESSASRVLEAIFSLAEQPKQKEIVLKDIANVFLSTMQRSELAGCSIVTMTLDRTAKNITNSSDNLASILLTRMSTRDPIGVQFIGSLLAQPAKVGPLFQHPRPAVKKAALEIAAMLGFGISSTPIVNQFWSQVAYTAVLKFLHHHDANLRVKALTILENYPEEVVAVAVSEGGTPGTFASTLRECLIDKSVLVRKRAVGAFAAIVVAATRASASTSATLLAALQANTAYEILQLPRDSKLYPGEAAATNLCTTLLALAQPANSPDGALRMLSLYRTTPDDASRLTIQSALAEACLSRKSNSSQATLLEALLVKCTDQEVTELRSLLHSATAANRTLAARVQAELAAVAETLSENITPKSMESLSKMIYVLGPPQPAARPAAEEEEGVDECRWLLSLTDSLADQPNEAVFHWFLRSLKLWMEQLEPDSRGKLATELLFLIIRVAAGKGKGSVVGALTTALSLVHLLPNAREAFESLLERLEYDSKIYAVAQCPIFTSMAELYVKEKADFLSYLKQQQQNERSSDESAVEEQSTTAPELLQFAQKYIDDLLEELDTVPAAYIPALLEVAAYGRVHNAIRAEALKALEAMACLSQPLSEKCIGLVTSLLQPQLEYATTTTAVTVQAIKFLASLIQAFPTAYGSLIPSLSPFLALAPAAADPALPSSSTSPPSNQEVIAIAASSSFAELVLSNKIKVHDCLGILGSGIASSIPTVASTCTLALRQLLATSTASGDRASFVLGIAHQTPLGQRRAATAAAFQLLSEADLGGDALVGPCIAAVLNACQPAAALGLTGEVGIQIILEMLKVLSPSVKVLKILQKGLQGSASNNGGGGVAVPRALRRELEEFVKRAAASSDDSDLENRNNTNNGEGLGDAVGTGQKRGRSTATTTNTPAAKATTVKKLQQDIFGLLAVKKTGQKQHRTSLK